MRSFWVLTRLRMLEILRVPSTALFFFGMPLVMLLLNSYLFSKGQPYEHARVGLVGVEAGSDPQVFWETEPSLEVARAKLETCQIQAVLAATPEGTRVLVVPSQRLLGAGLQATLGTPTRLEVIPTPPWGFVHFLSPGILGFAIIMSGLFGLGYSLARYRQTHFLRKLATTPLSKTSFIASQITGRGLLVVLQCLLLLGTMHFVFALPMGLAQVVAALGVTLMGLVVFLGIGFLLACLVRNEGVLGDVINSVGWPLVLGSEIFFPSDILPAPLPLLADFLPSTQLVRLLRSVLLLGDTSLAHLAPGLLVLLVWAVLTLGLGGLLFRWAEER